MRKEQAQFILDDFARKFDGQFTVVNPEALPALERLLVISGLEFNKRVKENLEKSKRIATGKLADVEIPIITKSGNGYVLEVGYELGSKQMEYFDYINKGVKGTQGGSSSKYNFKTPYPNRKMAAAIYSWLNLSRKSIRAVAKPKTGLERKRTKVAKMLTDADNKKSLAYAISTNIKKKGIKGNAYFDKALKQTFGKEFQDNIETALNAELTITIRSIYGNNIR